MRARVKTTRTGAKKATTSGRGKKAQRRGALPDFLGIGVQKGGTTWLYENLRRHPEIFIPVGKEVHYFDRSAQAPLESYTRLFGEAGKRRKGELTPAYGILPPRRIRQIAELMPEVRLVLVLRDPVERAWSQARMELADRKHRAVSDVPVREWLAFVESHSCVARSQYVTLLRRWLRHFPPEQLFVCFSEELERRPREVLSSLFDFLGVSIPADWSPFALRARIVPNVRKLTKENFGLVVPARARRLPLEGCPPAVRRRLERLFGPERRALRLVLDAPGVPWLASNAIAPKRLPPKLRRLKLELERVNRIALEAKARRTIR